MIQSPIQNQRHSDPQRNLQNDSQKDLKLRKKIDKKFIYLDVFKFFHHRRPVCQNECSICQTKGLNVDNVVEDIEKRVVVLFGFEPTLYKRLGEYIQYIQGYKPHKIILVTNGIFLGDRSPGTGDLLKILDVVFKDVIFIVKLFGHNALTHDAHTRVAGSFEQAVAGISKLRSLQKKVLVTFPNLDVDDTESAFYQESMNLAYSYTNTWPVKFPRQTGDDPLEPLSRVTIENDLTANNVLDVVGPVSKDVPQLFQEGLYPTAHILTGPFCNIQCTYCNVVGGDKSTQKLYSSPSVKKIVDYAATLQEQGIIDDATIDFIGGEPTVHPRLAEFISYAKAKPFQKITICTNGLRLQQAGYLDSLIEAGLTGVRFSFHSHIAQTAEKLADRKNSGIKYIDTAKLLLSQKNLEVFWYRILLSENILEVEEYLEWLFEHNQTQKKIYLILGMPSLRGRMFFHQNLFPDLKLSRQKANWLYRQSKTRDFYFSIHHAPGCLVPEDESIAAENYMVAHQYNSQTQSVVPLNFEGNTHYVEACSSCKFYRRCPGLPEYYIKTNQAQDWVRPFS